jgi:hypothetical protein
VVGPAIRRIFIIAAVTASRYKTPAVKLMGANGIEAIIL